MPFGFIAPKTLNYLAVQSFRFWAYLMKVILSIPDEGYFERTWWRLFWAYLMKVILSIPDEGYFECTWWRLFYTRVVHTKLDIYIFIIDNWYKKAQTFLPNYLIFFSIIGNTRMKKKWFLLNVFVADSFWSKIQFVIWVNNL